MDCIQTLKKKASFLTHHLLFFWGYSFINIFRFGEVFRKNKFGGVYLDERPTLMSFAENIFIKRIDNVRP